MISAQGIGSGLDIAGIVDQLVTAERTPTSNRLNLREARANAELSALGQLKSALSSFQDALSNLKVLSEFQQRAASSANENLFLASATSASVPGSYDIEVLSLAEASKIASAAFTDSSEVVGTGTLSFDVDGTLFDIEITDENNTLEGIRDAINESADNLKVQATIVTADDGAHLVITSRNTGVTNGITQLSQSGGDGGLAALEFNSGSNSMTEITAAADAQVVIDGFAIASASNTIAGAIDGVSIELISASPGEPAALNVVYDEAAARESLQVFVDSYNELASTIDELTAFDVETGEAGPLLGDATIRGVESSLRRELSNVVNTQSIFSTLSEIGITTNLDGELQLDNGDVDAAIAADFDAVGRLFASEDGIAVGMDAVLANLLGGESLIQTREDGLQDSLQRIADQRADLDRRMEQVRRRYEIQFNAMDALLAQLQQTSTFLSQQLNNLNNIQAQ